MIKTFACFLFFVGCQPPIKITTVELNKHYFASEWAGTPSLYMDKLEGKVRFWIDWNVKVDSLATAVLQVRFLDGNIKKYCFKVSNNSSSKILDISQSDIVSYRFDIVSADSQTIASYIHPLWVESFDL